MLDDGLSSRGHEDGSIQVLLLGYLMVLLVVVSVVTAATSLYLERKRLFSLADAAALASAEAFDLDDVAVTDGRVRVGLRSDRVREACSQFLADAAPTAQFDQLVLVEADSPDSRSAAVRLQATWHPPLIGAFLPLSIPVAVTSHARVVLE